MLYAFLVRAAAVAWVATLNPPAFAAQHMTQDAINQAALSEGWQQDKSFMIKAQVLLDRARFSPGVIDGRWGMNTERAIRAFQQRHGLDATGELDQETWQRLSGMNGQQVVREYEITSSDVKGPFIDRVPHSFKAMAKLDALSYTGPEELLGEKFHMDVALLRGLNPEAAFRKTGTTLLVTRVRDESEPDFKTARIEVRKSDQSVRALGEDGTVLAYYPATIGSAETPSPSGTYKVEGIAKEPEYRYDPKRLNFPDVNLKEAVTIAPGPNNPVGRVWIALSKESYGIHGTPDPGDIRREASHGCVRLTNWDAIELANATRPGVTVEFMD